LKNLEAVLAELLAIRRALAGSGAGRIG